MSTKQTFAFCLDCWELHYGIPDKNGVYSRDSGSSNHADHAVHVFGVPDDYPPPIRNILASLHAGLPVSDGRAEVFSLAIAIHALQPNVGTQRVSTKTVAESRAQAAGQGLLDLAEEGAA